MHLEKDINSIRALAKRLEERTNLSEIEVRSILRALSELMAEYWLDHFTNQPGTMLLDEGKRRLRRKKARP